MQLAQLSRYASCITLFNKVFKIIQKGNFCTMKVLTTRKIRHYLALLKCFLRTGNAFQVRPLSELESLSAREREVREGGRAHRGGK
jgi:hypothetical protein